ncbi:MAG: hypothetical protein WCD53_25125 [Microcoleus sp.]
MDQIVRGKRGWVSLFQPNQQGKAIYWIKAIALFIKTNSCYRGKGGVGLKHPQE